MGLDREGPRRYLPTSQRGRYKVCYWLFSDCPDSELQRLAEYVSADEMRRLKFGVEIVQASRDV